ncbi:hypothetical protein PZ938_03055 [Luteipulveratus sp. YIM 133132]|uniref:hypothetical protein n=1 Tax=Luteipulveratus flavus TaxID=3031728 RepID=UPI0023AF7343|nr:hypothetical protein [Luteipulveratus sp. YIM 133132]MDE9364571.1 hypothetical protein [Luteipulveratus sp. YIM 133132]
MADPTDLTRRSDGIDLDVEINGEYTEQGWRPCGHPSHARSHGRNDPGVHHVTVAELLPCGHEAYPVDLWICTSGWFLLGRNGCMCVECGRVYERDDVYRSVDDAPQ